MSNEAADVIQKRLVSSPVNPIIEQFCASSFKLAPETADIVVKIRDIKNLRLRPTLDSGFHFRALHEVGAIEFGVNAMERSWAYSYCFAFIQCQLEAEGRGKLIRFPDSVRKLWIWAHAAGGDQNLPWPDQAPVPLLDSSELVMRFANDLFIGASGWILFHELGHILHKDNYRPFPDADGCHQRFNHSLEKRADLHAFDYALADWRKYSADERIYLKRGLMVASGLLILAADVAFSGEKELEGFTHPSVMARIEDFFSYLEKNFPEMTSANLRVQDFLASNLFSLVSQMWWPNLPIPMHYDTPVEVFEACKKVFVPASLDPAVLAGLSNRQRPSN